MIAKNLYVNLGGNFKLYMENRAIVAPKYYATSMY